MIPRQFIKFRQLSRWNHHGKHYSLTYTKYLCSLLVHRGILAILHEKLDTSF